ncbi:SLAM family member 9-like isoform X2 [Hypanus sabinus]|uniref:SLAM family member 9-like isoform X2 n=1 Tax=Hypanus sabinus TaxID=79690 RepID=UPI0028C3C71C|nr:SLAM family member 9-like isoform X2 [Hypanus sabinus]
MLNRSSRIISGSAFICLLLCNSRVLAESDGNLATRRVVNGILGQSITLQVHVPGESITAITWDYMNSTNQKKVKLCEKYPNNPIKCYRQRITLNPEDYSLEIQNLTDSDKGLYEINPRTSADVHEEVVVELQIYERVSTPIIISNQVDLDEVCNISLHCLLERGSEPVYTWWTGDDEVMADESHVLTDGGRRLELSLRLNDNNTVYNCTVRNPVSEATTSVDLRKICLVTEGQKPMRPLHIGLITAAVLILSIMAIAFVMCLKKKEDPKFNEAANTERRSESVLYAVIRRANIARDQRHLHQLDANEGQQNPKAQLTTIYDEIKYNPDVNTSLAATNMEEKFNAER